MSQIYYKHKFSAGALPEQVLNPHLKIKLLFKYHLIPMIREEAVEAIRHDDP